MKTQHDTSFETNMANAVSTRTALIHKAGKAFRKGRISKDEYLDQMRKNLVQIEGICQLVAI